MVAYGHLAQDRTFLLAGSFFLLFVAVAMNIVGLNIGKWLQNAGGVGTYVPLLLLLGAAGTVWWRHGSVTHFTWANALPLTARLRMRMKPSTGKELNLS